MVFATDFPAQKEGQKETLAPPRFLRSLQTLKKITPMLRPPYDGA